MRMDLIYDQNQTNTSYSKLNRVLLQPEWNSPFIGLLLLSITLVTIFGNVLVILAVIKERNLKSVANYYIISLAVADLIVGLIVMPISALNKVTNDYWFFGDILCDVWHSIDICASTASINSLLIIALDRHSAISDPISYHNRLLTRYWLIFVVLIWICSVFISFPAIAYWRWVTPEYLPNRCDFPNDLYYLVFSSLVSFYIPLPIMIFVYVRIYRAATRQMNALKTGQKLNCKTSDGKPLILRIHRGGNSNAKQYAPNRQSLPRNNKIKKLIKDSQISKSLECLLIDSLKHMRPFTGSFSTLLSRPSVVKRTISLNDLDLIKREGLTKLKDDQKTISEKIFKKFGDLHRFDQKINRYNPIVYNLEDRSKKQVIREFNGSVKKAFNFYQNHYMGHEAIISRLRINPEKSNFLSLPKDNETSSSKQSIFSQTKLGKRLAESFRLRRVRQDSGMSNTSNFYFNYETNEAKPASNSIATKVKGLTLAKKFQKFTREQKAAKTLGIVMGVFIICWLPFFIYNVITGIFKANMSDSHEIIFFVFTWFGYINSGCNPIIYAFSSREFRRAFYKILFPTSFLHDKKRKNYYFSMQSSTTLTRESKHVTTPTKVQYSFITNYKKSEILNNCTLCKTYESLVKKRTSVKPKSITSSTSNETRSPRKRVVGSMTKNFRKKLNTVFNGQQTPRFNSTSLRLNKINRQTRDLSGSFYSRTKNSKNSTNKKSIKLSPSKHSLSVSSMSSNSRAKKPGQIPVGTRYRFKTIKPPVESDMFNNYTQPLDIYDKLRCSNESSYECNEDDEYFNQIHSNIMKKKLESCNSNSYST